MTHSDHEDFAGPRRGAAWLPIILNLVFWFGVCVSITRCSWTPPPAAPPCDATTFQIKLAECAARVRLECPPCEAPSVCTACAAEDECNAWAEARQARCVQ